MRDDFHQQLDTLRDDLARMCTLAGTALRHATAALLDGDQEAAGLVFDDVERLRLLQGTVERRTVVILARQAPVAGDLRTVVSAIRIAADADRMGGLAALVARMAVARHPGRVLPDDLTDTFGRMADMAIESADRCVDAVRTGHLDLAGDIRERDDAVEEMHADLHRRVVGASWPHGCAVASDVVLLGRFYGRFADHAAEIARRVRFQAAGVTAGI